MTDKGILCDHPTNGYSQYYNAQDFFVVGDRVRFRKVVGLHHTVDTERVYTIVRFGTENTEFVKLNDPDKGSDEWAEELELADTGERFPYYHMESYK